MPRDMSYRSTAESHSPYRVDNSTHIINLPQLECLTIEQNHTHSPAHPTILTEKYSSRAKINHSRRRAYVWSKRAALEKRIGRPPRHWARTDDSLSSHGCTTTPRETGWRMIFQSSLLYETHHRCSHATDTPLVPCPAVPVWIHKTSTPEISENAMQPQFTNENNRQRRHFLRRCQIHTGTVQNSTPATNSVRVTWQGDTIARNNRPSYRIVNLTAKSSLRSIRDVTCVTCTH